MRILVTGDKGYIGRVLSRRLISRGDSIKGLDAMYYVNPSIEDDIDDYESKKKDIRDVELNDLEGFDCIVHLASLSNDPLGEFDKRLTKEINLDATIKLAELAKKVGVKRFVNISSQSMYGVSNTNEELDEVLSTKNPQTMYAETKWKAELALNNIASNDFTVVHFRPSTVYGWSTGLRCDIVYNSLLASGYTSGSIEVKSDGTPWRPIIHVQDVCNAIEAGLDAPKNLINGNSYNVGIKNGNYRVKELAMAAQQALGGIDLRFTGEHSGENRTYKVSFDRIHRDLGEWFKPKWNLKSGGDEIVRNFRRINFSLEDFRGVKSIRLNKLKYLISNNQVGNDLRWIA